VTIDPGRVSAFARALGADPAAGVPPTYAVVYGWEATAPQLLGDPEAGIELRNLLHTDQEFAWTRHPRPGERVVARTRVAADVLRRGLRFLTVETEAAAGGEPLCWSTARLLVRPGAGEPAPAADARRPAASPPAEPDGLRITFTREQIAAYAEASGDRNPIHLDDEVARSMGLPGVIAHGMLQLGLAARAAADAAGGPDRLRRLSCRFAGMVRPGDTVTFRAGPAAGGRIEIAAVNQDGQPVLTRAFAEA
jgi:acyl dehydratase